MSDDDADVAPVLPLRPDDEELVALESAVLDDLEARDSGLGPDARTTAEPPPPLRLLRRTTPEDRSPDP